MSDQAPTSLLDIGDLTEQVKIGKATITMKGLNAGEIFDFLIRYPVLREVLDKKKNDKEKQVTQETLLATAPQAVYEAVAMCDVNLPRDALDRIPPKILVKAARRVQTLAISDQLRAINMCFDLTFTDGVGPFVDAWVRLMGRFEQLQTGADQAMMEAASVGSSPAQSQESVFTVDTPYNKRGVPHLVN